MVAYRQSIRWFQESGNRGGLAHHFECFAMLALDDGQAERAARLYGAAHFTSTSPLSRLTAAR